LSGAPEQFWPDIIADTVTDMGISVFFRFKYHSSFSFDMYVCVVQLIIK